MRNPCVCNFCGVPVEIEGILHLSYSEMLMKEMVSTVGMMTRTYGDVLVIPPRGMKGMILRERIVGEGIHVLWANVGAMGIERIERIEEL